MQLNNKELSSAKTKYRTQRRECFHRVDKLGNPIEMRLTFEQWLNIWLSSGHWHERGNKCGHYVMSRFNDLGHYEFGNIEIKTVEENNRENKSSSHWRKAHLKGIKKLNQNPEYIKNHRAATNKPISCNNKIFPSMTIAAEALAPPLLKQKICWLQYQMKKDPTNYFYIENTL